MHKSIWRIAGVSEDWRAQRQSSRKPAALSKRVIFSGLYATVKNFAPFL
jgi:hypothetical protein